MLSCTTTHLEHGTETGNPPVLDVDKLELVVANDSVRIVGRAGAVRPGGTNVEATIVGTGEIVRSTANADGSFDIRLEGNADVVVEVRARAGDQGSSVAYVARGGALVSGGEGASLSCMQRTNLASQAAGSLTRAADTSCESAADCTLVSYQTSCTATCNEVPIAASAVARLRAGIASIDRGVCADFAGDGCNVIVPPCVAPPQGPLACVAGECKQLNEATPTCPSCLPLTLTWRGHNPGYPIHEISGCDDYQRSTQDGPECTGKIAHCGASGKATLEELIAALAHPDVELAESGRIFGNGSTTDRYIVTNVKFGMREFPIVTCDLPGCTPLPEGLVKLRDLLDRIASETVCETLTCPPNAIFTQDRCYVCDPQSGGCTSSVAGCAIVCSDSSQCSGGLRCSARGICEAVCGP